jgi:hypothetical protein
MCIAFQSTSVFIPAPHSERLLAAVRWYLNKRRKQSDAHSEKGMPMFDDKLTRARRLIEQRDQIDQELRVLFGELPQQKRGRQRNERAIMGCGPAASGPQV